MNINDINATLGNENNIINADLPPINYIPGYKIAEEERRANEVVRQTNEASRIALYEDMEHKRDTDYYRGEQGPKGDDGVSPNAYVTQNTGSATITITDAHGTTNAIIYDGEKGDKGDKGDPGAIKFLIVESLPATGADDTIYLVPITPDVSGNNYAEYIYVNGSWELLGKIGVQVDLTNYVTNTDYATNNTGGVVKVGSYGAVIQSGTGKLAAQSVTYSSYLNKDDIFFISKGTLENVITGKELTNKSYVDDLVGDIATALDTINGEEV